MSALLPRLYVADETQWAAKRLDTGPELVVADTLLCQARGFQVAEEARRKTLVK